MSLLSSAPESGCSGVSAVLRQSHRSHSRLGDHPHPMEPWKSFCSPVCVCVCLSVAAQSLGAPPAPTKPGLGGCQRHPQLGGEGVPGCWDAPGWLPRVPVPGPCPGPLPPGPDPTGVRSGFWGAAYLAHDIGRGLAAKRGVDSAGGTWSLAGKLIHPERREGKTPRTQAAKRCCCSYTHLLQPVPPWGGGALLWVLMPAGSALVPLFCFDYS